MDRHILLFIPFLVAEALSVRPSVGPSVGPSVRWSVRPSARVENWENAHIRPCPPVRNWWPRIRPCFYKHLVYMHAQPQILGKFKHSAKHALG